jgi:hypothetical protein
VHLEVTDDGGLKPPAERYSRCQLCASVDGDDRQCVSVAKGQHLPMWHYGSLADGDHELCSWLEEEEQQEEEVCQTPSSQESSQEACASSKNERLLETCVGFRKGNAM